MSIFRYKSAIRSLALTLLVVVTAPFLFAQTPESAAAPTRQERLRVFDQVWRTVSESYHDERFNGVDWRAQRQIFRPLAEMATTRAELYSVLRRMLGTLGDAHTRVYAPEESFDRYQPSGISVGLLVRPIEGRPTVTWVDPDSAAAEAGLRPGYRILAVDGEPARQLLERIRRDIGASSTPLALELQSYERLLQSGNGRSVTIEFADENERTQSITLQRRLVEHRRRAIPRLLPHRIGYIELTGFGQEVEQQFEQAMEELQDTRGLILDLRNNGGGFVNSVLQIAATSFPSRPIWANLSAAMARRRSVTRAWRGSSTAVRSRFWSARARPAGPRFWRRPCRSIAVPSSSVCTLRPVVVCLESVEPSGWSMAGSSMSAIPTFAPPRGGGSRGGVSSQISSSRSAPSICCAKVISRSLWPPTISKDRFFLAIVMQ
jgi:C-terminal processing protease CtpA/Prc